MSKVLNWHDISPFERNDFHMQNRNVIVLSSSPILVKFRENIFVKKKIIIECDSLKTSPMRLYVDSLGTLEVLLMDDVDSLTFYIYRI